MPELNEDVQKKPALKSTEESELIRKLFEYADDKALPWRKDWLEIIRQCYLFSEGKQWEGMEDLLKVYEVPPIPVDRLNRGLDNIKGKRLEAGLKKKISKQEMGDERMAEVLNILVKKTADLGVFEDAEDDAFESLLKTGLGLTKLTYNPDEGDGTIHLDFVEPEDVGYSRHKLKDLSDVTWIWQQQLMEITDAMRTFPEKAGELRGLQETDSTKWEELKGSTSSTSNNDYEPKKEPGVPYKWENQVKIWTFWILHVTPVRLGLSTKLTVGPDGKPAALPNIRRLSDGEQLFTAGQALVDGILAKDEVEKQIAVSEWFQYIVAGEKKNSILVRAEKSDFSFQPFSAYISERKKSGSPRGYIERNIPHQVRINIAWAQKVASFNKAMKTPLVTRNLEDIEKAVMQSKIGAILNLTGSEEFVAANVTPPLNTPTIEEGNAARADMDFDSSATEAAVRGVSNPGDSALKLSLQQSAALIPMNRWVKAEGRAKLTIYRNVLEIIIKKFSEIKVRRIIGEQKWLDYFVPKKDPATGQVVSLGLTWPPPLDASYYDVVIEDQSASDFQKQQSFNAVMAIKSLGVPLDDEYIIRSAPIKDTDEAILSNQKARADILQAMQMQIQMLGSQVQDLQKQVPKTPGSQKSNAARGAAQPQNGKRSMIGGQNG